MQSSPVMRQIKANTGDSCPGRGHCSPPRPAPGRQPAADRPAAYLHFLAHWGQEADFHGCAFINASAEFGNPQSQPHQQARQHKQNVLEYLEDVCTGANLPAAAPLARQLFLLGEGLIVTMQVMGHAQVDVDAALAAWQQLTCR